MGEIIDTGCSDLGAPKRRYSAEFAEAFRHPRSGHSQRPTPILRPLKASGNTRPFTPPIRAKCPVAAGTLGWRFLIPSLKSFPKAGAVYNREGKGHAGNTGIDEKNTNPKYKKLLPVSGSLFGVELPSFRDPAQLFHSLYVAFCRSEFPTVHDVLHADYQEVAQFPHPPLSIVF